MNYKEMSDDQLSRLIRMVVGVIDRGGVIDVDAFVKPLRDAGLVSNIHMRSDLSKREAMEWYAGQILDIVESRAWFAMNSAINCCRKFVGGDPL